MSIFGNRDDSYSSLPVIEGYGVDDMGAAFINMEAYDDMLDIVKSIHALDTLEIQGRREVSALQESGMSDEVIESEMEKWDAVHEAWYSSAWESIKKFFVDLGKKIKAFFATMLRWFNGFYMTAKKFAEKYGKEVVALDTKGNLKGYKIKTFDNEGLLKSGATDVENVFNKIFDTVQKFAAFQRAGVEVEKNSKNKEELDKVMTGAVLGTGPITRDKFHEELYSKFRGSNVSNAEDKKEMELSASKVVAFLKDDSGLKAAKKAGSEMEKHISHTISEIEKFASHRSDADKEGAEKYQIGKMNDGQVKNSAYTHSKSGSADVAARQIEAARLQVHLYNVGKTDALAMINAWKTAIEEKMGDYMRYCRGAFGYKKKDN